MLEAFAWGAVASGTLLLGAVLAYLFRPGPGLNAGGHHQGQPRPGGRRPPNIQRGAATTPGFRQPPLLFVLEPQLGDSTPQGEIGNNSKPSSPAEASPEHRAENSGVDPTPARQQGETLGQGNQDRVHDQGLKPKHAAVLHCCKDRR